MHDDHPADEKPAGPAPGRGILIGSLLLLLIIAAGLWGPLHPRQDRRTAARH